MTTAARYKPYSKEIKNKVISLVSGGKSLKTVADEMGISYFLVARWVQKARLSSGKKKRTYRKTARVTRVPSVNRTVETLQAIIAIKSLTDNQRTRLIGALLNA